MNRRELPWGRGWLGQLPWPWRLVDVVVCSLLWLWWFVVVVVVVVVGGVLMSSVAAASPRRTLSRVSSVDYRNVTIIVHRI